MMFLIGWQHVHSTLNLRALRVLRGAFAGEYSSPRRAQRARRFRFMEEMLAELSWAIVVIGLLMCVGGCVDRIRMCG